MPFSKFPAKMTCYLMVLFFLLSIQGSITHSLDVDDSHHEQHHCSLFQTCTHVLPSEVHALEVIFAGIIKSAELPILLTQYQPLAARVRGPPASTSSI
ncbi:MAG: DUF2607 family protein [Oceanospirillaceae bacterium]|nr:DUF2607 family protein [Oceanospirillaceae bacterium]